MYKETDKIRLRLFGVHLGYIDSHIINTFQRECVVLNINVWIRTIAYNEFKIFIHDVNDLEEFIEILHENYYEGICDWIREKIRIELKNKKCKLTGE